MRFIRIVRPLGIALALSGAAACSTDSTMAPRAQVNAALSNALLENGEVAQARLAPAAAADTAYASFVIDDDVDAWYGFGPHRLYVPRAAVCDPGTSGYGIGTWLRPCRSLGRDVAVTVKWWTDSRGNERSEFKPDLRFAPGRNVWLYMKDPVGASRRSSAILYCEDGSDICVNESLLDPRLATRRDARNDWVYRIIRHFSGYNVWA